MRGDPFSCLAGAHGVGAPDADFHAVLTGESAQRRHRPPGLVGELAEALFGADDGEPRPYRIGMSEYHISPSFPGQHIHSSN